MLRWMIVVFAALALACGDSTSPNALSISGAYNYVFGLSNQSVGLSCQGVGQMTLGQDGAQFSGTTNGGVVCTGPGGELTDQGTSQLTGGRIDGDQVTFRFQLFEAGCSASGVAYGSPVNNMSGSATCSLAVAGQTVVLNGTWQASR